MDEAQDVVINVQAPFVHDDVGYALGPSRNPFRAKSFACTPGSFSILECANQERPSVACRVYDPPELNLRKRLEGLSNAVLASPHLRDDARQLGKLHAKDGASQFIQAAPMTPEVEGWVGEYLATIRIARITRVMAGKRSIVKV